jgi:hypothetical protein
MLKKLNALIFFFVVYLSKLPRAFSQMVMAVFAYIYHQSFIAPQNSSVEIILDQVRI